MEVYLNLGHFSLSEERGPIFIFLDPEGSQPVPTWSWREFLAVFFFPPAANVGLAMLLRSMRFPNAAHLPAPFSGYIVRFYAMFNNGLICVSNRGCEKNQTPRCFSTMNSSYKTFWKPPLLGHKPIRYTLICHFSSRILYSQRIQFTFSTLPICPLFFFFVRISPGSP